MIFFIYWIITTTLAVLGLVGMQWWRTKLGLGKKIPSYDLMLLGFLAVCPGVQLTLSIGIAFYFLVEVMPKITMLGGKQ